MHAFFSFFFAPVFRSAWKTKAGERCRNKCKVGEKEGSNRATNKKGKEEEKVKDENVSYPLLETVTLICSVSSHTSAFARRSSLSLSPQLSVPFVVSTSRHFSLFSSFIPCSLSPAQKLLMLSLVRSLSSLLWIHMHASRYFCNSKGIIESRNTRR